MSETMSPPMALSSLSAINPREGPSILPLRVRDLVLKFADTIILDGLSLDLGNTGCTIIMGQNGSGKTLLLKLLHGLIDPNSGSIDWGGQSATAVTRRQALVFQKPILLRRSVAANMDFVLKACGMDRSKMMAWLDHAGLAHKAKQPARLLSGGEAQRLALARALASEPEVLLLDEPTANLDPASVLAIEAIVKDAARRGVRIIFVTHDIGQARRMADDVVFIHRGRVVEHSTASKFFPTPQSSEARDYLNGKLVV